MSWVFWIYLNNLPQEAEDEMFLSIADVVWSDVYDVTADSLSASQSKFKILKLLVDGQGLPFVDGAFVDGIWRWKVDQFALERAQD